MALLNGSAEVERTIQCLREMIPAVLRSHIVKRCVLSNERAVADYLRSAMAFEPIEQLRVLFLNAANELLEDELFGQGTVRQIQVYPREIMKRGLELGATALILAHNHPSGRLMPSNADKELTRLIVLAAGPLDIVVHDHFVVGRRGVLSFRAAGFL